MNSNPLNVRFNRALIGDKWDSWVSLVQRPMGVHLKDEPDIFRWHLNTTGVFTIKSMYANLMKGYMVFLKKILVET
jgi:hypothetical protein